MANWNDPQPRTGFGASPSLNGDVLSGGVTFDAGLRKHMLSIYNYMSSGVLLSGVIALVFGTNASLLNMLYSVQESARGPALQPTLLGWIVMLAPLGIVLAIRFGGAERFSESTLKALFWVYAALFGASISYIMVLYTGGSIAGTFFATAGAFAGTSLFGYTTKRNLGPVGSFLTMGVIGLIIAMALNLFVFQSGSFDIAISAIGVLIFAGLTAYYTQSLKEDYAHVRGTDWEGKSVVLGALTLYIAFINMFMFLLRFLGSRD